MSDFQKFKTAVAKRFEALTKLGQLYRVDIGRDEIWDTYLGSFPPGANMTYRKRTEFDCSCCKNFIRNAGNIVAIHDNDLLTIWDNLTGYDNFDAVTFAMSKLIKSKPIANVLLHPSADIGTDKNYEDDGGTIRTWNHFHIKLPNRNDGPFVVLKENIPTMLGDIRTDHEVLLRSLKELSEEATNTTIELIDQGSLYRGTEFKAVLVQFQQLQKRFNKLPEKHHDTFVWEALPAYGKAVVRMRNTAIGTILIDLSSGVDLEEAVRKFESVMAPHNYKRPTALVTDAMVKKARDTVEDIGLSSALERRYAALTDISITNVLFANRNVRKSMKDSVFDQIQTKKSTKKLDKVEKVSIESFIQDIIPNIDSMEVLFENRYTSNLVSLIAPVHKDAGRLFKWNNNFSWSYNGDVADSVRERVKKAGGNVDAPFRCSLAWYNTDDLDLHMLEAGYGLNHHISFATKWYTSPSGGRLDVDMNVNDPLVRDAVENIFYESIPHMHVGKYDLWVNQYRARERDNVGFDVEIYVLGDTWTLTYDKAMKTGENVKVASFEVSKEHGIVIKCHLPSVAKSKTLWGIPTQDFREVSVFLKSPNYWDGQGIGNKHYFFMLNGCVNDGQARGFYNEFLRNDLDKHRKVIEIVGSKSKTAETHDQLSGLGFSETKHTEITVRVKGNFTRTLVVTI